MSRIFVRLDHHDVLNGPLPPSWVRQNFSEKEIENISYYLPSDAPAYDGAASRPVNNYKYHTSRGKCRIAFMRFVERFTP